MPTSTPAPKPLAPVPTPIKPTTFGEKLISTLGQMGNSKSSMSPFK
jgi:hypothetical protein